MIVDIKHKLIRKKEIYLMLVSIIILISILAALVIFFIEVNNFHTDSIINDNQIIKNSSINLENSKEELKYGLMTNIDFRTAQNNNHNFQLIAKKMQKLGKGFNKFFFDDFNLFYKDNNTQYRISSSDSILDIDKGDISFDNEITIDVNQQETSLVAKNGTLNFVNLQLIAKDVSLSDDSIAIKSNHIKFDSSNNTIQLVGKSVINIDNSQPNN